MLYIDLYIVVKEVKLARSFLHMSGKGLLSGDFAFRLFSVDF